MAVLLLFSHQCGHTSLPSEVPTRARVHKLSPGRQVLQAPFSRVSDSWKKGPYS